MSVPFPPRAPRTPLICAALFLLQAATGSAQHIVFAEHKGKVLPVRAAARANALVRVNDKLVVASGRRYALHKVDEYLPVFVAVRHLRARTSQVNMVDTGGSINHQFEFKADFVSAYPLENVFLVLDLQFEDGSNRLFLHEIGRLGPKKPQSLDLVVPTALPLGAGRFQLHVFSEGMEVLHSEHPFAYREAMLDRIVAKRTAGRPDGPPEPFLGPPPEYPRALLKSKTPGSAKLRLRVRSTGAVIDAVVLEASDPAFGQAAVDALRQWRFLPAMKHGRPIDTSVEMPLAFDPADP